MKTLIETNPYLKDTKQRKELVARSVRTSCGVEGISPKTAQSHKIEHRSVKKIYQTAKKKSQPTSF